MALLGMAAAAVGMVLMTVIISKVAGLFSSRQTELGKIDGQIEEIYSGHNVVKVYNGEKAAKRDFHKMNDSLYECAWKKPVYVRYHDALMIFIGNLAYVVVCITGAVLCGPRGITFGTIVAFMLYIRLLRSPAESFAGGNEHSEHGGCMRARFEFWMKRDGRRERKDEKRLRMSQEILNLRMKLGIP